MKVTIMTYQFLRFAAVGAAGFLVDAAVLALGLHLIGLDKYLARLISFLCAATFTWAMNRRFTFAQAASQERTSEWARFVAVNGAGGMINYGTYAALVTFAAAPFANPFAALAFGSLAGLLFNFFGSKFLVFRA
ncbi:MAG: GtrA family protein [Alphaproteobacteria bacterium]